MGYSGKVKRKSRHSPEGEKYRILGEGSYTAGRRKILRLRKEAQETGKPETKQQKEKGTYIGPSSGSQSEFPPFKEWCKQQGRSPTMRASIDYQKAKRRHQGAK